ncbi:hypothetical protein [Fusobacterium sp. THCT1E2]
MRVNITENERKYLLSIISTEQKKLIKKLKNTRQRKSTQYRKCIKEKEEKLKLLEELIKNNYNLTNEELFVKMEISKATFYKNYSLKAKELKKIYKSQSLFK